MEKVMIKRLISVCIAVILVFGICGCAQTAEDASVAETETVEYAEIENEDETYAADTEETDMADAESESEKTAISGEEYSESEEQAEPIYIIQPEIDQPQTHRYELYVEDVTWDEAKRRCEEKGGYLATIRTLEEYEYIKKGLEDSGQTQIAYWLGASDRPATDYGYRWHEPNWSSLSYEYTRYINYSIMEKYWADGEPGYSRQVSDEPIDRLCIYFLYDDAKENCYLYNAPKDMLMRSPEYTGKIGYICEYGVTVKVKETYYSADGSVLWWDEYGFDDVGNQTEEIEYDADGSVDHWNEYECDSIGNRIKDIEYNADGSVDWRCEHEYDSAGNRTKEIYYYNADGSADWWCEHEYDSRGNKTKQTYSNKNGPNQECEWEYDNMANLTKYMEYRYGELYEWYECEYITINLQ